MFYIKFRFGETFTVISSVTKILLFETQHYINLELLAVDILYTYRFMFYVRINSNILYILTRFLAFFIPTDICTVAITNIRNMHAISTNPIADI